MFVSFNAVQKRSGGRRTRKRARIAAVLSVWLVAVAVPVTHAADASTLAPVPATTNPVILEVSPVNELVDGAAVDFSVQTSGGTTLIGSLSAHLCAHGFASYGTTSFGYSGNNGSRCVYQPGIVSGGLAGADYELIAGPFSGSETTSGTLTFHVGTGSVTWGNVSGYGPFTLRADANNEVDLIIQVNLSGDGLATTYFIQPLTFAAPGTPPGPPTGVRATTKNGAAALSWKPPANAGSSPISGYAVTPIRAGTPQPPQQFASAATTETITSLTNGATYTFAVAAINAAGTGPQSAAAASLIVGAPGAPGSPGAQPGATTTSSGPIIVTFTTPANNGAAITKFTATCTSSNGGASRSAVRNSTTAAPITVTGATLAKTYTCRVVARNSRGGGVASNPSNALVVGAPAQPATPSVARIGAGVLRITFTRLTVAQTNGAPLTAPYYVATCTSGNGGIARSASSKTSPMTVGHLTVGKSYSCTIRAHNARGNSTPSRPSTLRTA